MARFPRLFVTGALTVLAATGCGAASHQRSATGPAPKPIVVAHPDVRSIQLSRAKLRRLERKGAVLLSPSKVAFMTSGGVSCAWWPKRLTVLGPSAIRIDMRVNGDTSRCGSGAVGFPIAVTIDPRIVDAHRRLTVRLAYKVGDREWSRAAVAPAISRS
jgi:hypothetical protein